MIKRGIYAAALSVINKDSSLNIDATISHAENLIKKGLHGVFFFWINWTKSTNFNVREKGLYFKNFEAQIKKTILFRDRK